ncbi:hypothetical protein EGW08_003253, partial [Elysia chlorotica]
NLNEDHKIFQVLSAPLVEGFEQLQALAVWRNVDAHGGAVCRRSLVCVLTRVEAFGGQLVTVWALQLELLSCIRGGAELVCEGVEREVTGYGEGGHQFRGGHKRMSRWVGIITPCEVTVVRRDDGILLSLFHILSVPLSNARATGVGQNNTANVAKCLCLGYKTNMFMNIF